MRILWLKTELLHPVDKGGKIRTYQMLKELKRAHHITYVTLDDGTGSSDAREKATEYCDQLVCLPHQVQAKFSPRFYMELARNLISPLPYFITKYASKAMRAEIDTHIRSNDFDVLVCDFLNPSVNLPPVLPCASVLFQHNVEAMIWKRHAETQKGALKQAYLRKQWRKTLQYEAAACHRFDHVVAVSAADADMMRTEYGVDAVTDVPTGVDTEYFRPTGTENRDPLNLVFTGSMDWLPNDDAIRYFLEEIFPRVRASVPDASLTVVGRNPYPWLLDLSQRDPAIRVTGRVPDVRPFMERAGAFIVPMRIGGGTRLKIYEAMAMEMPIISTTIGAEGLPVTNGKHLLLEDTADRFADAVIQVATQQRIAADLGTQAAEMVREHFGWGRAAARFTEICEKAMRTRNANAGHSNMQDALPVRKGMEIECE